jgi:hypothetical protein
MICQCCEINDVESKKRPLCKICYRGLHKEGLLDSFPLIDDHGHHTKENLKIKYGESIIADFESLKNDPITLLAIGKKYGFTRERARQIYREIFGYPFTVIVKKRSAERIARINQEIINKRNPTNKVIIFKKTGPQYKGAVSEEKVLNICNSLGYVVSAYEDRSIDLVINGYLVDVKSDYCAKCYRRNKTPLCHFALSQKQLIADFVICHMVETERFFIIPRHKFPKGRSVFIPINQHSEWIAGSAGTAHRKTSNHWYEYLEAWHLLKPIQAVDAVFSSPSKPSIIGGLGKGNSGNHNPCSPPEVISQIRSI